MRKCDNCGKMANIADLYVDHVLPMSHPDYNELNNIRVMHLNCAKKVKLWERIKNLFSAISRQYGRLLCWLGIHDMIAGKYIGIRYRSKWDRGMLYEAKCKRCGHEDQVEKEY